LAAARRSPQLGASRQAAGGAPLTEHAKSRLTIIRT